MMYGGNYGRTTYGGVISNTSQIVGKIVKKGIAILITLTNKAILLTRTNKTTLTTIHKDKTIL